MSIHQKSSTHILSFSFIEEQSQKYLKKREQNNLNKNWAFFEESLTNLSIKNKKTIIHHALQTLEVLTQLKADINTLVSAIYYHAVYKNIIQIDIIERVAGQKTTEFITKTLHLNQLGFRKNLSEKHIEALRKMFLVMAKDLRVVLLKIVDRQIELENIEEVPKLKRESIVKEAFTIYCPLLNLLGIWQLLGKLEDLCFQYMNPKDYKNLFNRFYKSSEEHNAFISEIEKNIEKNLKKSKVDAIIEGRMKHLYSIYKKVSDKNKRYNEIYDVYAFRIITNDINECYSVLGIIHTLWKPKPGRFKDYIATPKSNGYQSLHTTVFGPRGKLTEFQIRTKEMDKEAEFGIAAHWFYKNKKRKKSRDAEWIQALLKIKEEHVNDDTSPKDISVDVFKDRIFVFTPKGDIIDLPKGATCLDFAYHISQELGNRTAYALINNIEVSLDREINTGDTVEVISSKNPVIKTSWSHYVTTVKAQKYIKSWFKKKEQKKKALIGKDLINKEFKRYMQKSFQSISQEGKSKLLKRFRLKNTEDLFENIGEGNISMLKILRTVYSDRELLHSSMNTESPSKKSQKSHILGIKIVTTNKKNILNQIISKLQKFNIKIIEIIPHDLKQKNRIQYEFVIQLHSFSILYRFCNEVELIFEIESVDTY